MKVESALSFHVPTSPIEELPVISAEQIRSILYLGIKGTVKLEPGTGTTVDTWA